VTSNPPRSHALHFLRHGLQVAVFNTVVGLVVAYLNEQPFALKQVYSQAIGLLTWAFIDFGRFALPHRDPHSNWPRGWRGVLLVIGGIVFGYVFGTMIGDAFCGCSTWEVWSFAPRKFLGWIAGTLVISGLVTQYFYNRGREHYYRMERAEIERNATLAKLALLQSQLEPHMLFNTLANLRVLIGLDPPRAQAMLDRLIAFLRATLSASRAQSHALAAEFERLDDYLELMSVRMGPRLATHFSLPQDLRGVELPPLLLQPLVENCIQHGLEPKVDGGRIEVRAHAEGDALVLEVRDTGVGLDAAPPSSGTRFGLKQVRERLHTLYGDRASLTLEAAADDEGGTRAVIRLPLQRQATTSSGA
jgi:hypothetical protein